MVLAPILELYHLALNHFQVHHLPFGGRPATCKVVALAEAQENLGASSSSDSARATKRDILKIDQKIDELQKLIQESTNKAPGLQQRPHSAPKAAAPPQKLEGTSSDIFNMYSTLYKSTLAAKTEANNIIAEWQKSTGFHVEIINVALSLNAPQCARIDIKVLKLVQPGNLDGNVADGVPKNLRSAASKSLAKHMK